ncbi:MAG: hypothetical protein HYZ44_08630 [Bacteroidetes bacterium]|nr:hypothetical protein [Bacteroidota bacterium]
MNLPIRISSCSNIMGWIPTNIRQLIKVVISSILIGQLFFLISCKEESSVATTRTYYMGFQNSAPRYDDFNLILQTLGLWSTRADAAMITTEVPWDSLLAGKTPQQYVKNNYVGLVEYYRTKKFKLWVYIDPQNGLNRTSDANSLVAVGKSIAQPEMQKLYRRFVVVMDSMLHPDHLGLALETNLIRVAAPSSIYNGVKKAANDAVADVRAIDPTVKLSVSVQADVAWGKLLGNGTYVGIQQDFTDFPFIEELGVSSYPYFDFSNPDDIPTDYYSKLVQGKSLKLMITEGGWTSSSFDGPNQKVVAGSLEAQQKYITRQSQLLDAAPSIAWFQLPFTDIDLTKIPANVDPSIRYFSYLGLVDINLQPKPSLTAWDNIFQRKLSSK